MALRRRSACRRDWTNIPAGPAGLIAERLLTHDVADYVRFRAASAAWRACSDDPRTQSVLDRRNHPRRWFIARHAFGAHGRRRRLLNMVTGECINMTQPDSRRYILLGPTAEGLLVLCRRGTLAVQLLNPLTGQVGDLPPADTLINREGVQVEDLRLLSAGLTDHDSTVVLLYRKPNMWFRYDDSSYIAVAKPGDKSSTRNYTTHRITSAVPFAGRFYCAGRVTSDRVMVFELQTAAGQRPQLMPASDRFFISGNDSVCLVDNNRELIVIHRIAGPFGQLTEACKVYRVDLDAEKMTWFMPRVDDKRAVFISRDVGHSLSVHAGLSPSISGNAIYFCKRQVGNSGLDFDICDMLKGIAERDCRRKHTCSIVDHLARYVLGSW